MSPKIKLTLPKTKTELLREITDRAMVAIDQISINRVGGKVTLKMVCDSIGFSSSNLSRIRREPNSYYFPMDAVARLCETYGISPKWVILGHGDMRGNDELIKSYRHLEERITELEHLYDMLEKRVEKRGAVNKAVNKTG